MNCRNVLRTKWICSMLPYKREEPPKEFINKSRKALEKLNAPGSVGWPNWNEYIWKNIKPHFDRVQHQKCGYRERDISSHGDVEHYRPKGIVQELKFKGREKPHSKGIEGRDCPKITEQGYWWLAYEWDNYLLSCKICNSSYKRSLFPVKPERAKRNDKKYKAANPKKEDLVNEVPLLINPFEEGLDTYNHFEYDRTGAIRPRNKDERGKATIEVCGLDRTNLGERRFLIATDIWTNAHAFLKAKPNSEFQKHQATHIYFYGHESRIYAGMVRIIFRQVTNWKWDKLEKLIITQGWMHIIEEYFRLYEEKRAGNNLAK